jgi:2-polyprenyl-3-methyl-5-hydroxy-6-metoxy-1,4-benzoquinol methylase
MTLKALAYAISDRLLGILPAVCGHWSFNGLRFTTRFGMGLKPLGALVRGRYEAAELSLLQRVLQKEDRVLEIGSGLGFLALNAAKIVGAESVLAIEANAMMVEAAQRSAQLNSLPVTFHHGVISDSEGFARFRLHPQFWRS